MADRNLEPDREAVVDFKCRKSELTNFCVRLSFSGGVTIEKFVKCEGE